MQASSLLESIPRMFSQTQHADACLGAAVKACIDTLKVPPPTSLNGFCFLGCAVFHNHPLYVQCLCSVPYAVVCFKSPASFAAGKSPCSSAKLFTGLRTVDFTQSVG